MARASPALSQQHPQTLLQQDLHVTVAQVCRSQPKYCIEFGERRNFLTYIAFRIPALSWSCSPFPEHIHTPGPSAAHPAASLLCPPLGCFLRDGFPIGRCLLRGKMMLLCVQSPKWHRHTGVQNDSPGYGRYAQHLCHSTDVGQRGDSCYCQNANE